MSMSTHSTVTLCNLFKRVQNNNLFTYNYFIQNIAALQTGYPGAIFFTYNNYYFKRFSEFSLNFFVKMGIHRLSTNHSVLKLLVVKVIN